MDQAVAKDVLREKYLTPLTIAVPTLGQNIRTFFQEKHHVYDEISPELLYRNRVTKARFFLIHLLASFTLNLFCMYLYFLQRLSGFAALNIFMTYMGVLILSGIILLPYHPTHYGLNLNKLAFNLRLGLGVGAVGLVAAVGCRCWLVRAGYQEFAFVWMPGDFLRRFILYLIMAPMQELVVKGYFQSFFMAMFEHLPARRALSIVTASFVFAQFHLIYGLPVVLITFVFACVTGWIYEQSRSCVGVTLIHFLTGAGLLFFSNAI